MAEIKGQIVYNLKHVLNRVIPTRGPDFIIVGAQKSGTSSLFSYLNQHPKLLGARQKEINYFNDNLRFHKGKQWYEDFFKSYSKPFRKGLRFEATPEYLYHQKAAERIKTFNPSLKIIIVLREPVKRAFSAWNMFRNFRVGLNGKPPRAESFNKNSNLYKELYSKAYPSFEDVVVSEIEKIEKKVSNLPEPSFIRRGIYLPQIKAYTNLFGKDQVLVLGFKDLIQYKIETLNSILNFLDLEESDWSFLNDEIRNQRPYTDKINPETEQKLLDFYKVHNEELFKYLGHKPNW